jgi:hypothetical protein
VGVGGAAAVAEATLEGAIRVVTNADGTRTFSFDVSAGFDGGATIPAVAGLTAGTDGQLIGSLTVDANNVPIAFQITTNHSGSIDLTGVLADASDVTDVLRHISAQVDGTSSTRIETTLTLQLDRPQDAANLAAVEGMLGAIAGLDVVGAAQHGADVAQAIASDSRVAIAVYDDRDLAVGASARGRVVIGLGGGVSVTVGSSTITSAHYYDREIGRFVPWTDCVD